MFWILSLGRLEFDPGVTLYFLTRDKERTYVGMLVFFSRHGHHHTVTSLSPKRRVPPFGSYELVERFTSRKQELLLPIVQHMPQAQMLQLLQSNQLEVANEDHVVLDAISAAVFKGTPQDVRLYVMLTALEPAGNSGSGAGAASAAAAAAATAATGSGNSGSARWQPRTLVLSEHQLYLCQESYQTEHVPLLLPAPKPVPGKEAPAHPPAPVNPTLSFEAIQAMGLRDISKGLLMQAWQAPVSEVTRPPIVAFVRGSLSLMCAGLSPRSCRPGARAD